MLEQEQQATNMLYPYQHTVFMQAPNLRAKKDARLDVVASIRDSVRNLPSERQEEIFADFEGAVKSKDINYLADTMANWALGGHGYGYAGEPVNDAVDNLPDLKDDADLSAAWEAYKANN
jgi:hypothetical protein